MAMAETLCSSLNKVRFLVSGCGNSFPYLPPLACGGSSRFDGGLILFGRWPEAFCCRGLSVLGDAILFSTSLLGGAEVKSSMAEL